MVIHTSLLQTYRFLCLSKSLTHTHTLSLSLTLALSLPWSVYDYEGQQYKEFQVITEHMDPLFSSCIQELVSYINMTSPPPLPSTHTIS